MKSDSFEPTQCILKELDIRFSLYYSPEQFAQTFAHLAAGDFDVAPSRPARSAWTVSLTPLHV